MALGVGEGWRSQMQEDRSARDEFRTNKVAASAADVVQYPRSRGVAGVAPAATRTHAHHSWPRPALSGTGSTDSERANAMLAASAYCGADMPIDTAAPRPYL